MAPNCAFSCIYQGLLAVRGHGGGGGIRLLSAASSMAFVKAEAFDVVSRGRLMAENAILLKEIF